MTPRPQVRKSLLGSHGGAASSSGTPTWRSAPTLPADDELSGGGELEIPHELLAHYDLELTKGMLAPAVMIHEDERGHKFIYKLGFFQRLFLTIEDPNLSWVGRALGFFMLGVIAVSCLFYVISSLDAFKYTPTTCVAPVCQNDPKNCPNAIVCEPVQIAYMSTIELICVIIFTIEYGMRMVTVWSVPPRLVGLGNSDGEEVEMGAFDSTKEAPETLFLAQLKYLRMHLDENDRLDYDARKSMENVKNLMQKERLVDDDKKRRSISHYKAVAPQTVKPVDAYGFALSDTPEYQRWLEYLVTKWDTYSRENDKCKDFSPAYRTFLYGIKILNIIDLLAVLPFYIELMVSAGTSVTVVRVLRLVRVFRVFKMGKNSKGVEMLAKTFYNSLPALSLLAFFIALGVILFGAVIFFLEQGVFTVNEDYPKGAYIRQDIFGKDEVSPYTHILASSYWAVIVSTSVGYGELVPTSTVGKVVACLCAYYGVLLLALPITVIGSNFKKLYEASHGKDDDVLVLDCLDGISKAVYLECIRAEEVSFYGIDTLSTASTAQSCIYSKMMGIVSTFDSTKQNLMKAAISNANDTVNRTKLHENLERVLKVMQSAKSGASGKSREEEDGDGKGAGASARSAVDDESGLSPAPSASSSPIASPRINARRRSYGLADSDKRKSVRHPISRAHSAPLADNQPMEQLNIKPSEAVDLLLGHTKKSKIRELDVQFVMPVEPMDLHLPMREMGLPRSSQLDTLDLAELRFQVQQLSDIIRQLPIGVAGADADAGAGVGAGDGAGAGAGGDSK